MSNETKEMPKPMRKKHKRLEARRNAHSDLMAASGTAKVFGRICDPRAYRKPGSMK